MNTLHRVSLPLVLLMFFVAGCNDSTPPEYSNPSGKQKGRITSLDYSSIQNPLNYQNFYGVIHNAGVDYIYQQAWDSAGDSLRPITSSEGATLTVDFLNSVSDSLTSGDLVKLKAIALSTLSSMNGNGDIDAAFASMNLSTGQIAYYHQMIDEIRDSGNNDLSSMLAALSTIETNIINSTTLSYAEKSVPLAMVAIAKHSAFYHAQYFDVDGTSLVAPSTNGFHKKIQGIQNQSEQARWKKVLEADLVGASWGMIGGFIQGAIRGGIGGLLTGGPAGGLAGASAGALVGAGAGMVAGAVVGSGTKLVDVNRQREN